MHLNAVCVYSKVFSPHKCSLNEGKQSSSDLGRYVLNQFLHFA